MLIDYSEKIAIKDLNIFFSLSNFNNSENTKTIAKMNQTHSNKSIFIDRLSKEYEDCDGIFTSNKDLALEVCKFIDKVEVFEVKILTQEMYIKHLEEEVAHFKVLADTAIKTIK